jgi:hypothetical protein
MNYCIETARFSMESFWTSRSKSVPEPEGRTRARTLLDNIRGVRHFEPSTSIFG